MAGTFNDQAPLAQLYQEAYSPITNYGQGALALAMQKRQEAIRAAELDKQRQSRLDEEQFRQQQENARSEAANKAVFDRWKLEHDTMESDKKEEQRKLAVEKANQLGAKLPANTPFDIAAQTYVDLRGQTYIEANRRMGAALSGVLRNSGTDPKAFVSKVSNLIADDPAVAKALTVKEREEIRNNPDKLAEFRKQFSNSSTKKYEAFVQAMSQATSTITTEFEKESASKPELIRATADLRVAADNVKAHQKDYSFSPGVEFAAFQAYSQAAKPPTDPAPAQRNFALPRGGGAGPAVPTAAQPAPSPAAAAFPGSDPMQDIKALLAPAGEAVGNIWQNYAFPSSAAPQAPAAPASAPVAPMAAPNQPADPSTLARLRWQKFMQDAAASNQSLFPVAYPAIAGPIPGVNSP